MQYPSTNPNTVARRIRWLVCILAATVGGTSIVVASGFPPVANDDEIVVVRGTMTTTLSDGSSSVIDNDFDQEGDRLYAFLTRNPRRGSLSFRLDGTFVYQHSGGRNDGDNFSYVLYDGTSFSQAARVVIDIVDGDPIAPIIVSQSAVFVNEDFSLNVDIRSLNVVDPDNNFPNDFDLEVSDGENYSRLGTVITPTANFNGRLAVPVRVFDGDNFSNQFLLLIDVLPQNDAPFVTGSPAAQETIENDPFQLSLAAFFDDIDASEDLRFSALGLPGSRSLTINADSGVLSGTPTAIDVRNNAYNVRITATDSGGLSASLNFALTIFPANRADLSIDASVSVNPVTVGESAQWNIVVTNLGPQDLDEGELVAHWSTSGPVLSLTVPQSCSVSANNSDGPVVRCPLNGLVANASQNITVQGTQNGDGDNSLIAVAVSDDPIRGNNSILVGAQVVAEFSEGPTQILGVSGTDVASEDLNGDGHKDLVVTSEQTTVFLNSGNRTVTTPGISLGADSGGTAVVILDWNGDTNMDIAVAGIAGAAARIYLNNGSGGFGEGFDLQYPNSGNILAADSADFDQNGFDDLVLTGTNGTRLLGSSGAQGFSLRSLQFGAGIDVSVTDINGDAFMDIIAVEAVSRAVNILRNSGNGRNFTTQRLQRGSVATATSADLDGDGDGDLLLAIDGLDLNPPESLILYQHSDGTFPAGISIGASPLSKMLAGDVDGDQLLDIIALNDAGVHQYYRGQANGGFSLNPQQIVSAGMRGGVLVDFNSDESLDLILAGADSRVVEIHANNGIGVLGLGDRNAPVVQLIGDANVVLPAGGLYDDPGASATDDIDGDLSNEVQVSGSFNPNVVGTYTLTYSVSDQASNLGTAIRTIKVGVNDGTGGGGGGVISPAFLLLLFLIQVWGRRRQFSSR